jgi:hypothetical protein
MIKLLLDHGADPNEKVYSHNGRTVWQLFLLSCYEVIQREEAPPSLAVAWSRASGQLISRGADLDSWIQDTGSDDKDDLTVSEVLDAVFGKEEAARLRLLGGHDGTKRSRFWPRWLPWG